MGKRKHQAPQPVPGSSRVEIIVEELSTHPRCMHGPTLLFSGERGEFYACASCRDRECSVRVARDAWNDPRVREKNEKYEKFAPRVDKGKAWESYQEVISQPPSDRAYCVTCDALHRPSQRPGHATHTVVSPLSDRQLARPSSWLPPLQNDSVEAQYLFSGEAIDVILGAVKRNNISNILCIGTPSIHEAVQQCTELTSLLLDYDSRHHRFCPPDKFLWYNMFNHHFFNGRDDEQLFEKFLESSRDTGLCVVLDPPFGGRVEPIAHTLTTIGRRWRDLASRPAETLLPIIWAFPYFSEPYIINLLPELQMNDYQVQYTNHTKFKASKPNKLGSPVRLFTNLPQSTLDLSHIAGYKLCPPCDRWVSRANRHCAQCARCTSKSGATYVHCAACGRCVKPTYVHCDACGRCCQRAHACGVAIPVQSCYHCKEKGHKRIDCPKLKPNNVQTESVKLNKRKKRQKR